MGFSCCYTDTPQKPSNRINVLRVSPGAQNNQYMSRPGSVYYLLGAIK